MSIVGTLVVKVVSASDLPRVERVRGCDAMVKVIFQDQKKETDVVESVDPEWNKTFHFKLKKNPAYKSVVTIKVYDQEFPFNRFLGETEVSFSSIRAEPGKPYHVTKTLRKAKQYLKSTISLVCTYCAESTEEVKERITKPSKTITKRTDSRQDFERRERDDGSERREEREEKGEIEEEIEEERDLGDGTDEREGEGITTEGESDGGLSEGESGEVEDINSLVKFKKRTKPKSRGIVVQSPSKRLKLPSRLTNFQVRVHIIEGRHLLGGHMNPIVKVICGAKSKRTSVIKGTNNPFFDELIFFNFNEYPSALFDNTLELRLLNSKITVVRSENIIGSFKLDLGTIYDQPDSSFVHKWLLLTDPDNPILGIKGYLKFSVHVLSPGIVPKPTPPLTNEDIDVETNLLSATGVELHTMTLQIRIYRAQDLPQMDPEYFENIRVKLKKFRHKTYVKKDLVDPYCSIKFAGHSGRTDIVMSNDDPIWNQQINIGFRFPSMSERIRIRLKDYDKGTKNDTIGTVFLRLPDISSPGLVDSGYLPTFGPCFVNVYGSPREFSVLPDKYDHLNKGVFKGVAYRGRVLLEINTVPDQSPRNVVEDVKRVHINQLSQYLRLYHYRLFVTFYSATMISPADSSIEYEVSIGNYGNVLDENSPAQMSTTPPMNPIFDGNYYYYIPWSSHKPCVLIDSQWENNTHRMDSMNILLYFTDKLGQALDKVNDMMTSVNFDKVKCLTLLLTALETVISDISKPFQLPVISKSDSSQGFNDLDRLKYSARDDEITSILESITTSSVFKQLKRTLSIDPQESVVEIKLESVLDLAESIFSRMEALTVEPQISVPDVIIWMLSGGKRVACCRIPSHVLMYSDKGSAYSGNMCDKIVNIHLRPPAVENEQELEDTEPAGSLLRLRMWLGLKRHWKNKPDIAMLAETYQNEAAKLGGWSTDFLRRPAWSDASGKILQRPDDFVLPNGWEWEDSTFVGDWTTKTEDETEYMSEEEGEEGKKRRVTRSVEVIFEFQKRRPFSHWPRDSTQSVWKDVYNEELIQYDENNVKRELTKDEFDPPQGWDWEGKWDIDIHRSCDQDGWDYSFEPTLGGWSPHSKNYHIVRRRKWLRTRVKNKTAIELTEDDDSEKGWEYARFHFSPYQRTYNKMFLARRRRYIRKIKTAHKDLSNPPHFYLSRDGEKQQVPRLFLQLGHTPFKFELRVYLYQARDLYAGDATGLSDPFCVVSCGNHSQTTREIDQTLNPLWDNTRIFTNIRLYENPVDIKEYPPQIIVELFDKDNVGKDYLGYVQCRPIVRIRSSQQMKRVEEIDDDNVEEGEDEEESEVEEISSDKDPQTKLSWYKVTRYGHYAGELLAAFELLLIGGVPLPKIPRKVYGEKEDGSIDIKNYWYRVPRGIRPVYKETCIEILCWGVRDLKRYRLRSVTSPFVKIECGGQKVETSHILNTKKNPNFTGSKLTMTVNLPTDSLYTPPFNIHVYDKRPFGQTPLIGTHVIKSVNECMPITVTIDERPPPNNQLIIREGPKPTGGYTAIQIEMEDEDYLNSDPDYIKNVKYDWWTKYDATIDPSRYPDYIDEGNDILKIYPDELENHFHDFYDIIKTFPLYRGKGSTDLDDYGSDRCVGKFKGSIRLIVGDPVIEGISYEATQDLKDVIVRVYIIEAKSLLAQDPNGKSDPYVKLILGDYEIDDSDNFIPNSLNPKFGRVFEIPATLPLDHTLKIQILDHDYGTRDDFIGETEIDIENRFISSFRATCGIPQSYTKYGPNRWRDNEIPTQILGWYCDTHKEINNPIWNDDHSVWFNGEKYSLQHEALKDFVSKNTDKNYGAENQQLALAILRRENYLVPEHVETRTLYNPAQPGISQGSLCMWVDIFPKGRDIPPPVDISLRKPEDYVLRVIIYDVKGVELSSHNKLTGEYMSDIFVKGWLRGEEKTQKTDVHYRSLDGEGNFNWRFVFPFKYLPAERKIVVSKKDSIFSINATENSVFPYFTIKVFDNDLFDKHLGTLEFNLTEVPRGARTLGYLDRLLNTTDNDEDTDNIIDKQDKTDDLFEKKRIRRWWPLSGSEKGKIEMEIEVMTLEEAELLPAGKGRDEPNMNPYLPPPNRPETSFLWITSPFKTFKFIIWRYYKWHIMFTLLFILIALLAAVFIYSTPEFLAKYFLDRLLPF